MPDLLDQVDGPVDMFLADGAYDGEPTRGLLASRFGMTLQVAIPPPPKMQLSAPMLRKPDNTKLRYNQDQQPVRRQSFWERLQFKLSEIMAHRLVDIKRLYCGIANAAV